MRIAQESPASALACLALVWSQEARAQVKLEYKFTEGDKFTYKSTSKTKQILTLQGMEIETESDQVVVSSRTVGKRRADSSTPVEDKVESLRVELSLPGGNNLTFDSTNPDAKIDNPALAFLGEMLKLAGETSYTIVLDNRNKVQAIEGIEKLLEKADKLSPPARDAIRDRMSTDKFKERFDQEHANLPDVLCRPGESWDRTEILDIGSGQTLVFKKRYEYVGPEKKGDKTLDKISYKCTGVELQARSRRQFAAQAGQRRSQGRGFNRNAAFRPRKRSSFQRHGKDPDEGRHDDFLIRRQRTPGALDLDHRFQRRTATGDEMIGVVRST